MNVIDVINNRYSVRAYKVDAIADDILLNVLNAARLAPTASNRQPFQIIVVHTKGKEEELLSIYPRPWFAKAPVVLCLCGLASAAWVRNDDQPYLFVDAGIVMDHIVLAATHYGLGTCFIAAFDALQARRVLMIPDEAEPILFTALGYPADKPKIKERKELMDLVRYDRW